MKAKAAALGALTAACLTAPAANAELYQFSYTFAGTDATQAYAPGSVLTGIIDGTADPADPDRVIVNSFDAVSLLVIGQPKFDYPSIENDEFNTIADDGRAVVMTFSGTDLQFRACPNGFTGVFVGGDGVTPNDCPFAAEGGFGFDTSGVIVPPESPGLLFISAAIGGGEAAPCFVADADGNPETFDPLGRTRGCRVSDVLELGNLVPGTWSLTALPSGVNSQADVDPTATIAPGAEVTRGATVEEGVVLAENVLVKRRSSVGANSQVGESTQVLRDVTIGEDVVVGDNSEIKANVTVGDGAVIGDNVVIKGGAYVCPGVVVGDGAFIRRNALVTTDVPATGEIPRGSGAPDPALCP